MMSNGVLIVRVTVLMYRIMTVSNGDNDSGGEDSVCKSDGDDSDGGSDDEQ